MKLKKSLKLFLSLYLFFLAGCAPAVPLTTPQLDLEAKKFQTIPGKSVIYIFREGLFGEGVGFAISLVSPEGGVVGKLVPQNYFMITVEPGKHQILSHGHNIAALNINTKAGKIYYVWQEIGILGWNETTRLHLVDEKRGQAAVRASKRAISILPER